MVHSSCWYLPVAIGGVETEILIDSGSTYNIIDYQLYQKIVQSNTIPLNESNIVLKSANGQILKVHGEIVIDMEISNEIFQCDVKVVSLGDMNAILGLDFIEKYDCTLRLKQGKMKIETRNLEIPLQRNSEERCARIQAAESIEIIPETEMIVNGHVNWKKWESQNSYASIEPSRMLTPKTGLMVARSVVEANRTGTVPVRIANFSDKVIRLNKGETLGVLDPVTQISEMPDSDPIEDIESSIDNVEIPEHLQDMVNKAGKSLSENEFRIFKTKILEYQDVFKSPEGKLGRTHLVEHEIHTKDARPVKQPMRRIPIHQQDAVDKELDKMIDEGIIEESNSPWSSPLVIVKKKCGAIRICSDMRVLNDLTVKDAYPIPNTSECLESLSGARWFCSLDLCQGYFQIPIREQDKCKTAFSSRRGHFHYNVMTMGLTNAGATFERLMETILKGLQWKICVLYLDDVVCYGSSFQETLANLETIFKRLRDANLKLKPSKCNLFQEEVEFLGHIVSRKGIRCCPKKLEAVRDWPVPKTRRQVRQFLGFAGYYRRFIRSYSQIAVPLTNLTKENVKYVWTEKCENAFKRLKEALISSEVLAFPKPNNEYILDTDASNFAIGAVLSQVHDGVERPIAYASKTLSSSQQNYCTTMRELLAVVVFVKHFHHYLYGKHFRVRCDHAPLKWLMKFKNPEDMLARWITVLSKYDFEIEHRRGAVHQNADGLSRIPGRRKCKREDCESCHQDKEETCVCVITDCVCVVTRSIAKRLNSSQVGSSSLKPDVSSDGQGMRDTNCCEDEFVDASLEDEVASGEIGMRYTNCCENDSVGVSLKDDVFPDGSGMRDIESRENKVISEQFESNVLLDGLSVRDTESRENIIDDLPVELEVLPDGLGIKDIESRENEVAGHPEESNALSGESSVIDTESREHLCFDASDSGCQTENDKRMNEFRDSLIEAYHTEMNRQITNETHEDETSVHSEVNGTPESNGESIEPDPATNLKEQPNWIESWSEDELQKFQLEDVVISKVLKWKSLNTEKPHRSQLGDDSPEMRALYAQWPVLEIHNNTLYRRFIAEKNDGQEVLQYVVPLSLRKEICNMLHDHITSCHFATKKTLEKLKQRFYWPRYKADIVRWCSKCEVCISHKTKFKPKRAPLQQSFTCEPMERISLDIIGPIYPTTERENTYILTVIDYFTRFVEAYPLKDQTAQTVADKLVNEYICRYGIPSIIHSDRGKCFVSELFEEMCKLLNIKKTLTARYRPMSNGLCENANGTVKNLLRSLAVQQPADWDEHLPYIMMAIRSTKHESTKATPNLLMFGREFRLPVDIIYPGINPKSIPQCPIKYIEWLRTAMSESFTLARCNTKKCAERQKILYDKGTLLRQFKQGDWVWVFWPPGDRTKLGRGWSGPYLVIKKLGEVNYRVQESQNRREITLHIDHMKRYEGPTPDNWIK